MTGRIWVCENCGAENELEHESCHDCGWDKFADDDEEDQSGQYDHDLF